MITERLPYPRANGVLLVIAGIVHILAPRLLLKMAEKGYKMALAVDFTPNSRSTRRVRAVGIGMVLAGLHLLYHGSNGLLDD